MLRKFVLAAIVAFGLGGLSPTTGPAEAAVSQPGTAVGLEQAAGPAAATKAYYRSYYRPYARPYYRPHYRPYARPYGYYGRPYGYYGRPYGYYGRPYGSYARPYYRSGCRVVTRRVWTSYGYRRVNRRVCY